MKKLGFWKITMFVATIVSLGASGYESNSGESVPMLKEVAQSCYILAIISSCFAYIFPLARKNKEEEEKKEEER